MSGQITKELSDAEEPARGSTDSGSPFTGLVTFDAKDPETSFPPIEPLRPPEGAPNVLLIMLDDAGFAAMNTFGGPCSTPTADRPAAGGLAKGGTVSLYIDGEKAGEGESSGPSRWCSRSTTRPTSAATEAHGSATTTGPPTQDFNGQIKWIQLDLGKDAQDADHLISPEERYQLKVALQ